MSLGKFVDAKWGDLVGLLLVYSGLAVVFGAALWALDSGLSDVGKGLSGAGLIALKLRSGNGRSQ